jgi:hypothetical protein
MATAFAPAPIRGSPLGLFLGATLALGGLGWTWFVDRLWAPRLDETEALLFLLGAAAFAIGGAVVVVTIVSGRPPSGR